MSTIVTQSTRVKVAVLSPYSLAAPALLEQGYFPLPIHPLEKRPATWTRADKWHVENGRAENVGDSVWKGLSGWQSFPESEFKWRVAVWSRMPGNAGVGVRTSDNLVAIDYDLVGHDDVEFDLRELLESISGVHVWKKGAKGFTAFFQCPTGGIASSQLRLDGEVAIDILAAGKQTVVPRSWHEGAGRSYMYLTDDTLEDTPPEKLPVATSDLIESIKKLLAQYGEVGASRAASNDNWQNNQGGFSSANDDLNRSALDNLAGWVSQLGLEKLSTTGSGYRAVPHWRSSGTGRDHSKRGASLTITPDGIRDFGADRGYTPVGLVMKALDLSRSDAWSWLFERVGVEMPDWIHAATNRARQEKRRRIRAQRIQLDALAIRLNATQAAGPAIVRAVEQAFEATGDYVAAHDAGTAEARNHGGAGRSVDVNTIVANIRKQNLVSIDDESKRTDQHIRKFHQRVAATGVADIRQRNSRLVGEIEFYNIQIEALRASLTEAQEIAKEKDLQLSDKKEKLARAVAETGPRMAELYDVQRYEKAAARARVTVIRLSDKIKSLTDKIDDCQRKIEINDFEIKSYGDLGDAESLPKVSGAAVDLVDGLYRQAGILSAQLSAAIVTTATMRRRYRKAKVTAGERAIRNALQRRQEATRVAWNTRQALRDKLLLLPDALEREREAIHDANHGDHSEITLPSVMLADQWMGTGKTRADIQHGCGGLFSHLLSQTTNKLTIESREKIAATHKSSGKLVDVAGETVVVHGMGAPNPYKVDSGTSSEELASMERNCLRSDEASQLARYGVSPTDLCSRMVGGELVVCEHHNVCGYQKMKAAMKKADILVTSHARTLSAAIPSKGDIQSTTIDENFADTAVQDATTISIKEMYAVPHYAADQHGFSLRGGEAVARITDTRRTSAAASVMTAIRRKVVWAAQSRPRIIQQRIDREVESHHRRDKALPDFRSNYKKKMDSDRSADEINASIEMAYRAQRKGDLLPEADVDLVDAVENFSDEQLHDAANHYRQRRYEMVKQGRKFTGFKASSLHWCFNLLHSLIIARESKTTATFIATCHRFKKAKDKRSGRKVSRVRFKLEMIHRKSLPHENAPDGLLYMNATPEPDLALEYMFEQEMPVGKVMPRTHRVFRNIEQAGAKEIARASDTHVDMVTGADSATKLGLREIQLQVKRFEAAKADGEWYRFCDLALHEQFKNPDGTHTIGKRVALVEEQSHLEVVEHDGEWDFVNNTTGDVLATGDSKDAYVLQSIKGALKRRMWLNLVGAGTGAEKPAKVAVIAHKTMLAYLESILGPDTNVMFLTYGQVAGSNALEDAKNERLVIIGWPRPDAGSIVRQWAGMTGDWHDDLASINKVHRFIDSGGRVNTIIARRFTWCLDQLAEHGLNQWMRWKIASSVGQAIERLRLTRPKNYQRHVIVGLTDVPPVTPDRVLSFEAVQNILELGQRRREHLERITTHGFTTNWELQEGSGEFRNVKSLEWFTKKVHNPLLESFGLSPELAATDPAEPIVVNKRTNNLESISIIGVAGSVAYNSEAKIEGVLFKVAGGRGSYSTAWHSTKALARNYVEDLASKAGVDVEFRDDVVGTENSRPDYIAEQIADGVVILHRDDTARVFGIPVKKVGAAIKAIKEKPPSGWAEIKYRKVGSAGGPAPKALVNPNLPTEEIIETLGNRLGVEITTVE